ncbi:unnamed protein product [Prunus armeniaca]|uniref:Uncharacterized protein n=1 Tax=Prunus armeniaca TaxID=36596 RepID=A0A6J5XLH8_PRUAR|nr:unnamed protein product [Prunus armeniaca]
MVHGLGQLVIEKEPAKRGCKLSAIQQCGVVLETKDFGSDPAEQRHLCAVGKPDDHRGHVDAIFGWKCYEKDSEAGQKQSKNIHKRPRSSFLFKSFETAISDRLPMAVVLDPNPVSDIMNMSNMSTLKMACKMVWSSPLRGLFTMFEVERHDAPFASPIFCIKISCCD